MRLRFTRRAATQLDAILAHIGHLSPQGRISVAKRVSDVLFVLSEQPFIGRKTSRARVRRIALVRFPYVLDYRVDEREIVVLGIRHTSRKPIP